MSLKQQSERAASRRPWRVWMRDWHRDLGYLAASLTLVYAISGLAVNHKAHWNPNRSTVREVRALGPFESSMSEAELVSEARRRLDNPAPFRSAFQEDGQTLKLFLEGSTVSIDLPTGHALVEGSRSRPVLHALNDLHLNDVRKGWMWVADAYALTLIFLALSGLVMLKGPRGFGGRGKWFALAGLFPVLIWVALRRG